ncbi:hypothetical protein [[Clostridium] hylemonae]|uniref:hypothetical protein n=1 Tax=[Clostridium] hylemonae TaxID=89153 RepID=UPI00196AD733|nr:hypothetical protein [[Clostridium] hylemonae]
MSAVGIAVNAHHVTEDERQILIQVQEFIKCVAEYFRDPAVEKEEQPVFPEPMPS